jgi:dipeptidyl aminopeptidase/acylaminoacyl peptidase
MTKQTAASGSWISPIDAATVAAGAAPIAQAVPDGDDLYWLAGRASENGRTTLLRLRGADLHEVTPAPFNVRSRVHEYGGGAYLASGGAVWFSNFADNRIYTAAGDAAPLTMSQENAQHRFADFVLDDSKRRLIAVREQHIEGETYPINTICAVGFDGVETVLVDGSDFYAAPRVSPDGRQLAWMCWENPRMPWQGTELWLADIDVDGTLINGRLIAGSSDEAICQPEWSPAGVLHFVSDRSGWWNLYAFDDGVVTALCPFEAEFATPHWSFGGAMYGFRANGDIVCTYIENAISKLAILPAGAHALQVIDMPYQEMRDLRVEGDIVTLLGGAPTIAVELVRLDIASGKKEVLARSIETLPDAAYLSVAQAVSYPSANGRTAHAFYYPPANPDFAPLAGELPPLMVIGTLKLPIQFWTSRGIAVLDVNYGGSSGFGRVYRDALKGQWGVVDVDDCVAGAQYLVAQGLVNPDRLVIRGGSAGGYTVLSALAFHDVFKAGASYYGVSDLAGLDADSHKFEARYTDYLIAPQPQAQKLYLERSPIHHADKLKNPMIFFQGLDDKVVPPPQSEVMVDALRTAGVPVAYMTLEGEGHGFRKADSIVRTLEAELYFYLTVFGITPPPGLPAVDIENRTA